MTKFDGTDAVASETAQVDEFLAVETRGFDVIPSEERHGKARELFLVWAGANTSYLYVVLGGVLVLFGLSLWQALAVVVIGNLLWVVVGILSISGSGSGTPSSVITRAQYGTVGNRVQLAINWPFFSLYLAINLSLGSFAGIAAVEALGVESSWWVKLLVMGVTATITLAIAVYGHATIVRMSGFFTVLLTVIMVTFGVFVLLAADWGYVPGDDIVASGDLFLPALISGIAVIASGPAAMGTAADYSRYLPASTSKVSHTFWVALGGFVPGVVLGSLGVLAGTVVDMSDPQGNLDAILPTWFYVVFLAFIMISTMTNNILTIYSSGLTLQAIGLRVSRAKSVAFNGVLGIALATYALFVSNYTEALGETLEVTVAFFAPYLAVYVVDVIIRRGAYDGDELHNTTRTGLYWYTRGINLAGVIAFITGVVVAALCLNTTLYQGPIAAFLNGTDISFFAGSIVSITLYVVLMKVLYPTHLATVRATSQSRGVK